MMRRTAVILAAAMAFGSTAVAAQSLGDWEQIGTRAIEPAAGSVTIFAFGNDSHQQIRLCSANTELAVLTLTIDYASGEAQEVPTQFVVANGQCSEDIALNARRREIEKLVVTYTPFTAQSRAPRLRVDAR